MARLLLLALLLPLVAHGCGGDKCTKCKLPPTENFNLDADETIKEVVAKAGLNAGFSEPTFFEDTDPSGCNILRVQCFNGLHDTNQNLPVPPGDELNVVVPQILPPPARIRRQAPATKYLYNYFIWTQDGRNHSLQSYWSYQRGDIAQASFVCDGQAQWSYIYPNSTEVPIAGVYCFWLPGESTKFAFGYDVPQELISPVLEV